MPFEPPPESDEQRKRFLAFEFSSAADSVEMPDGGLLFRGVRLLAEGEWTDSAAKTPCYYSRDLLARYAQNWADTGFWARHPGGAPRSADELIGDLREIRFEGDSVYGDVFFHRRTQKSRDIAEMYRSGVIDATSVEMLTRDKWNPGKKRYEAQEIVFTGAASVKHGACAVCKFPRHFEAEPTEVEPMTDNPEIKELAATVAAQDAKIKALEAEIAALKPEPEPAPEIKALEARIAELTEKNKALETLDARIKALEEEGKPQTSLGTQAKALEAPSAPRIVHDRMTGEVYRA